MRIFLLQSDGESWEYIVSWGVKHDGHKDLKYKIENILKQQ